MGHRSIISAAAAAMAAIAAVSSINSVHAFSSLQMSLTTNAGENTSRRRFVSQSIAFGLGTATASTLATTDNVSYGGVANAVGPIKIDIDNPTYTVAP